MSSDAEAYEQETTARVDAEVSRLTTPVAAAAEIVAALESELIAFRRDIHAHPELSWKEKRTTSTIAAHLRQVGLDPQLLPETTGCYVDIGPLDAPIAAAFRGDIDALPIAESTGLDYASRNPGVAHSCGHDLHTTVMLGLAWTLQRMHTALAAASHQDHLPTRRGTLPGRRPGGGPAGPAARGAQDLRSARRPQAHRRVGRHADRSHHLSLRSGPGERLRPGRAHLSAPSD